MDWRPILGIIVLLFGINNIPNYNVGHQQGNLKFTINSNLSQMPKLNRFNTYIFYILSVEEEIFDTSTVMSIRKIGSVEKNNLAMLVGYGKYKTLYNNEFMVTRVYDNYDQRYFICGKNGPFISRNTPIIIIDKIQNKFNMAILPSSNYCLLQYIQVINTDTGSIKFLVNERSLRDILLEIYPILNWEPISNIVNYPIDPNYLQTLLQLI